MEKWRFNSMLYKRKLGFKCRLSKSMDNSFDPIQNINVSEDIQNINVSEDIQNINVSEDIQNINVSEDIQNINVSEDIQNINVSEDSILNADFEAQPYKHLWVPCDKCFGLNYKRLMKSKMSLCEYCGQHLKMSSSDRIELLIDPGTWIPMDEDMVSLDPIEFDLVSPDPIPLDLENLDSIEFDSIELDSIESESISPDPIESESISPDPPYSIDLNLVCYDCIESDYVDLDSIELNFVSCDFMEYDSSSLDLHELHLVSSDFTGWDSEEEEDPTYQDRIDSYQTKTGLTEAVQTGIGKIHNIPVAIGVMDFEFMGGSMGSVVGEKITRLFEYATKKDLPVIIVCASGGARMQEGSFSLMQMAKIASALRNFQLRGGFYISILTTPTTGGVTASFGMLGNIVIAEPNAYIAFAGKRVIELTLNQTVPEGSQESEFLFHKGLFDFIARRDELKLLLFELLDVHNFKTSEIELEL